MIEILEILCVFHTNQRTLIAHPLVKGNESQFSSKHFVEQISNAKYKLSWKNRDAGILLHTPLYILFR